MIATMIAKRSFLALTTFLALTVSAQTYEQLAKDMRAAYDARDYARYLTILERMDAVRPNHPTVLVNTAGALALNGRPDEAIALLRRLLAMRLSFDTSDTDFDSLRNDSRFDEVEQAFARLRSERVEGADIAFTIEGKGLITEGIARDAVTGDLYVSSARKGALHRIRDGAAEPFPVTGGTLRSLGGVAIDGRRRVLWVCSTASPRWEQFAEGMAQESFLVGIDLRHRAVMREVRLPGEQAYCDDVTVGRDGTVYVSDSRGRVLRLHRSADAFETLVPQGRIRSPQGLVLSADERILYVADYGGPVRAIDVRMGDVLPLRMPNDFQPMGIDGLTRYGSSLIAVQNGVVPHRVVKIDLARNGLAIQRTEILEMNHPQLDEPTIGTVAGDDYLFVGASQGHRFERGAKPDEATLSDGLIFRIRLRPGPAR